MGVEKLKNLKVLSAIAYTSAIADEFTTYYGLKKGLEEKNPRVRRIIEKHGFKLWSLLDLSLTTALILITIGLRKYIKHPIAYLPIILFIALRSLCSINNIHQIYTLKKASKNF